MNLADVWLVVLGLALLLFAIMVIVCGTGGFFDVLSMLRSLAEDEDTLHQPEE